MAVVDRTSAPAADPWAIAPDPVPVPSAWWWRAVLALGIGLLGPALRLVTLADGRAAAVAAVAALVALGRWGRAPVLQRGLAVAAIVVVTVVAQRQTGAATVLLAATATATAGLVLALDRLVPAERREARGATGLLIGPLVVAGLAYGEQRLALCAAMLGLGVVLALVALRWPGGVRRATGAVVHGLVTAVGAVGAVVVAVLSLVLVYLPGVVVRFLRSLRPHHPERTRWRPVDGDVATDRRDGFRTFTVASGTSRRRNLVGTLVVLVALVGGALVVRDARTAPTVPSSPPPVPPASSPTATTVPPRTIFAMEFATPYSSLPAYAGVSWADELQREEGEAGDDTSGRYVNVTDGVRRTIDPPPCAGCPTVRAWFVGGSAAWGQGQRDDHTIASELVRQAAADGISLEIDNIAERGATLAQEIDLVEGRLAAGEPPPDLVIFYDGWNDVLVDVSAAFTGSSVPDDDARLSMDDVAAINERPDAFLDGSFGPEAGRRTAARYARLQDRIDGELSARGIATATYFQPDAFSSVAQMQGYEALSGIAPERFAASPFADALDATVDELGPRVTSLRHLFDDDPEPAFVGLIHQSERGASVVAEEMYRTLGPQLHELAG